MEKEIHQVAGMISSRTEGDIPNPRFPLLADEFEIVADNWQSKPGPGVVDYLKKFNGVDLVVLNGEGSIYRQNISAQRELFLAWFAKTRLGIPTIFINGTVHLTNVVPILPAMLKKSFGALDAVAVREPVSLRNLHQYAPNIPARMIPDSAFYLAFEPAARRQLPAALGDKLAGKEYFCVDPGAMPTDHHFGDRSAMFQLVVELLKIIPTGVLVASAPADHFMQEIAKETGAFYFGPEHNYYQLMALLENAAFQITGRYHNPILGTIVGCPTIAFSSANHKVHGACELIANGTPPPFDSTDLRSQTSDILAHARALSGNQTELRAKLKARALELAHDSAGLGYLVRDTLAARN